MATGHVAKEMLHKMATWHFFRSEVAQSGHLAFFCSGVAQRGHLASCQDAAQCGHAASYQEILHNVATQHLAKRCWTMWPRGVLPRDIAQSGRGVSCQMMLPKGAKWRLAKGKSHKVATWSLDKKSCKRWPRGILPIRICTQ